MGAVISGVLHIHCGDCAALVARQAALPGNVLAWRDSSAVGPCSVDAAEHRRLRARWWAVSEAEIQDPRELPRDRELVLWFGPDPFEQISLVEFMAKAPPVALSLAPLECGVGAMMPGDLTSPFSQRRDARDLAAPLGSLWRDFCVDDRGALRSWVDRLSGEARLPHLRPALTRVLDDRENDRTARQVRSLVADGLTDVSELMRRLQLLEDPRHGVWYGDVIVKRLRDQALERA